MTKYLLSQWEAIELFCKVVCKYENLTGLERAKTENKKHEYVSIEQFRDNDFLLQILRKYENPIYYRHFGEKYMKDIAKREGIARFYPKTLYNLSLEIRFSEPVVRTIDELLLLLFFIGEHKNLHQYRSLQLWNPNDRQRTFENTRWWLYYYEEYFDYKRGEPVLGITRAVVHLKPFAKLTIDNIDASKGEPGREEKYNGSYKIYGGSKGQYLSLEGNLANNQGRDLRILLHIGDDDFRPGEIALGKYHNVNNTIYSGTVIMERVIQKGSMKAKFFKRNNNTISNTYWNFFEEKSKNRIRVKGGIKDLNSLQIWIDSKKNNK